MIRVGSLFSGVGGLELGLGWGLGEHEVVWQVEMDEFCRAILAKHWPRTDRSITDVKAARASVLPRVDLLCGGFPCTSVSSAGKGEGIKEGTASGLWIEFHRIVGELRPRVVVVENVRSGIKKWLCRVRGDLHELGYRTRALGVSAADVGAPHRRARVFVIAWLADAYGEHGDLGRSRTGALLGKRSSPADLSRCVSVADAYGELGGAWSGGTGQERAGRPELGGTSGTLADAAGPRREGPGADALEGRSRSVEGDPPLADAERDDVRDEQRRRSSRRKGHVRDRGQAEPDDGREGAVADADGGRRESERRGGLLDGERAARGHDVDGRDSAREAEPGVCRGADGLPARMDRATRWPAPPGQAQYAWEPPRAVSSEVVTPFRRKRLRALGNAVVPQCAEIVGLVIRAMGLFEGEDMNALALSPIVHQEIALEKHQASESVAMLQAFEVRNADDYAFAGEILHSVKDRYKIIEAKRTAITQPINAGLRQINDYFMPVLSELEHCERIVKGKLAEYTLAQSRANEARMLEAAAATRSGAYDAAAQAVGSMVPVTRVEGVAVREAWAIEITNANLVPRELCTPDMAKIRAVMPAEVRADLTPQIPGVRVTITGRVTVR